MSRPGHCKGFVVSATGVALLLGVMVAGSLAGEPPKRQEAEEDGRPTIEITTHTDDEGRPVVKLVIDGIPKKKLNPERVQAVLDLFREGNGDDQDDRPAARRAKAKGDRHESEEDEDEDEDEEECEEDDEEDDERPVPANRREFEMELRLHIRRNIEEPVPAPAKEAKPATAAKPAAASGQDEKPRKKKPGKKPRGTAEQKSGSAASTAGVETGDAPESRLAGSADSQWQSVLPLLRQQADQFRRVVGVQSGKVPDAVRPDSSVENRKEGSGTAE